MTLQKKIDKYLNQFEIKKVEGEYKTLFKDNASQELKDSIMKAHGDKLPHEWTFNTYHSILSNLSDYDIKNEEDLEENKFELIEGLVDVYTSDLTAWLHDHNSNVHYLKEALENEPEDEFQLLGMAQYIAIEEIYNEVVDLLTR